MDPIKCTLETGDEIIMSFDTRPVHVLDLYKNTQPGEYGKLITPVEPEESFWERHGWFRVVVYVSAVVFAFFVFLGVMALSFTADNMREVQPEVYVQVANLIETKCPSLHSKMPTYMKDHKLTKFEHLEFIEQCTNVQQQEAITKLEEMK